MEVISGIRKYSLGKGAVVTIGNFDGLHIGHWHLINTVLKQAKKKHKKSVVYTFSPHPLQVFYPKRKRYLLSVPRQVENILHRTDLNCLIIEPFTQIFSQLSPNDFIEKYVVAHLRPSLIIVGSCFQFGFRGRGDVSLLKKLAKKYHFSLSVEDTVYFKEYSVSSSLIRKKIESGQWDLVPQLLGRAFSIRGTVIQGFGRGTSLGIPTLNLKTDEKQILPKRGVYITELIRNNKAYSSVTNIGFRPTFSEVLSEEVIEVHIIGDNFCESWKEMEYELRFLKYLRSEKKFPDSKALVQQIRQDIYKARFFFQSSLSQ